VTTPPHPVTADTVLRLDPLDWVHALCQQIPDRGQIVAQASRDKDEVLVADPDLDQIEEVRHVWLFFRDRRPETYQHLTTV